jgi:hypothetical protein
MVPPSTTVPESASPTRASTNEPVRTEIVPASKVAGDRAAVIEVAGERTVLPQQASTGNPFIFKHFPNFLFS